MFGLFDSPEEKAKTARLQRLQATPRDEKYRQPVPCTGFSYPQQGLYDFQVVQESKSIKLHTYCYPAANGQPPKAVCIIFHGLSSHVGKSAHIAAAMSQIGVTVVGFDFRGWGLSEGIRGYFEGQELHERDIEQFEGIVRKNYPNVPLFLAGLSWGGQTAFTMAVKHPDRYRGVILFAPAIRDNDGNAKYGKIAAKVIGAIMPKLEAVSPEGGLACKNPQVDEEFLKDPANYTGKIRPGTIRNLLNQQEWCFANYEKLVTPFVVIHGGMDKLVDPDIGHDLLKRSPAQDKELFFYENMWHNVWAEPEIAEIIPRLMVWLQKRF